MLRLNNPKAAETSALNAPHLAGAKATAAPAPTPAASPLVTTFRTSRPATLPVKRKQAAKRKR